MVKGKLFIQGMLFYAYHGRHEVERELGQKFLVDMEASLDVSGASKTDNPNHSVDEVDIYNTVKDILFKTKYTLTEGLAVRIAKEILKKFPNILSVKVRVRKPNLLVSGLVEYAGVEVELNRSDIGS